MTTYLDTFLKTCKAISFLFFSNFVIISVEPILGETTYVWWVSNLLTLWLSKTREGEGEWKRNERLLSVFRFKLCFSCLSVFLTVCFPPLMQVFSLLLSFSLSVQWPTPHSLNHIHWICCSKQQCAWLKPTKSWIFGQQKSGLLQFLFLTRGIYTGTRDELALNCEYQLQNKVDYIFLLFLTRGM